LGVVDSSAFTIGVINQSRSGSTVTLTCTAQHVMGILNCHWRLYTNATTVASEGEGRVNWNWAGHDRQTGWDEPNLDFTYWDCTYTILNATAGLYVILDFYSTKGQRTSRRVQLT